jgi:hypothetical protein
MLAFNVMIPGRVGGRLTYLSHLRRLATSSVDAILPPWGQHHQLASDRRTLGNVVAGVPPSGPSELVIA